MAFVDDAISNYLSDLTTLHHPTLQRMEERAARSGFPIVGPQVGVMLTTLTYAVGAKRVLELGSGFGYSAAWFTQALPEGGEIVLTDFEQSRLDDAHRYLESLEWVRANVVFLPGDALKSAADLDAPFDIVFNDINKDAYPRVVDVARQLLRPGGLLICDNMLWSGKVTQSPSEDDASTAGVRELTRLLFESEMWSSTLLPVRDGVSVSVRIG